MTTIWNKYKSMIIIILTAIVIMSVVRMCEDEPKIVTKTVTKTVTKHDTIIKTVISPPKTVYVQKIKTVKGDTEIVYVDSSDNSIKANEYKSTLKGTKASADVTVVTTGELLSIEGVFTYPEITNTTTIKKTSAKSGLFLFGQVPINANQINVEVGLLYQFKNKIGLMGSLQYNEFTKSVDTKVGLAINLF